MVGSMIGAEKERGKFLGIIGPYIPLTSSINETVAAYIHFDGRAKEEVATLLRRGEETWVNSRWVSIADSEGGGLAEREFLFREVGLERWLNGLDLKGETKDVAARIDRRKRRLEKKRRKKLERQDDSDEEDGIFKPRGARERGGVLRYGDDKDAPIQSLSDDESMGSSDTDPEDEMPDPEAAGQIKVSLFRVLASGEVKKGEYSPQFDAHDDDDMTEGGQGGNDSADVDHTTTFAKPKSLDPKTISTQTVTGIDPPNKPYAVFTFFYRGKSKSPSPVLYIRKADIMPLEQLHKMGILGENKPVPESPEAPKKKSKQLDASSLKPLKDTKGTVGFAGYRDAHAKPSRFENSVSASGRDMDSDADDDDDTPMDKSKPNGTKIKLEDVSDNERDEVPKHLTPEEIAKRGELAEGVKKIQLKRQHSFEAPEQTTASVLPGESTTSTPQNDNEPGSSTPPPPSSQPNDSATIFKNTQLSKLADPAATSGSPFKKQRASLSAETELHPKGPPSLQSGTSGDASPLTKSAAAPDTPDSAMNTNETEQNTAGSALSGTVGVAQADSPHEP